MCPIEALRLGYDTPEIRAAAAQMMKQQAEIRANTSQRSFGRARMHPDGSVEYARKGSEPPPDLDGFKRDPGNPWKFLPLWLPCTKRIQTQLLKPCGAISVLTVCANNKCPHKQKAVTFDVCQTCTFRQ